MCKYTPKHKMSGQRNLLMILMLSAMLSVSYGARILCLFPFPARSHKAISSSLFRELADRGHQVTVLSPYPENISHPNLTDITVGALNYKNHNVPENLFDIRGVFNYGIIHWDMGISITNGLLEDPAVQSLIDAGYEEIDLIIIEAFFNEAFLGFAHKYKAPIIQISTIEGATWIDDWFANSAPYSYVPDNYIDYGDRMNLWQRFMNALVGTYYRFGRKYYYLPKQDAIMREKFGHFKDLPTISELEATTSLIFLNHHFSLSTPKPLMPNMVQIGGMHIKTPKKLPQDLETYLSEASDGVIYFSMGTHLQSHQLPKFMIDAFLTAFSKLKQRVLWKWEGDFFPGQQNNVKFVKWLSQADVLAHPNIRLFITHCGISSIQEAAYNGVPLLGLPIFGDQGHNCAKAVTAGYGLVLDYENFSIESAITAMKEVLKPRYRENAKRSSLIYRDQPLTPLEQAVFWTEYVIRHKGAPHMRSAALDLYWYQHFLLDVIAVLTLALVFSVLLIYLLMYYSLKFFAIL